MAYKIDVLIIYAEADNTTANGNGWVDNFKHFLSLMLEQVLGRHPNILLKPEGDTITAADLGEVATLAPVHSPDFITSGACLDTLEEFAHQCGKDDSKRIFKVLRSPLKNEEQPETVRDLHGYELFRRDIDTGQTTDYKDYFDAEATSNYWMHIVDIAFDMHESIISLTATEASTKKIGLRKTVYLAETSHDLTVQRNIIKRELQRHGYKILPEHPLPKEVEKAENTVRELMETSDLAIHLIGTSYGSIPNGTDKSIVDIQTRLAAEKAKKVGRLEYPRLLWINPNLRLASEKQKTFIENIKRDTDISEGAEILQTPLEDFKNMIREDVIEGGLDKKKKTTLAEQKVSDAKSIYLIHDKVDKTSVNEVKKAIEKAGFQILVPEFEGELLDIRGKHISNLRVFDAAVVYQGEVNPQWVRMKVLDLLKAPGYGRQKTVQGRALIGRNNKTFETYTERGLTLIEDDNNMMKSLEAFLEDIK